MPHPGRSSAFLLAPRLVVRTEHPEVASAMSAVFSSFEDRESLDHGRSIELDLAPLASGQLRLMVDGTPTISADAPSELAPILEGALLGCVVRTRPEVVALHGGAVRVAGATVLLVGPKGSGKSTLAAWLGDQGFEYLGDEVIFIDPDSLGPVAFPKSATIKAGAFGVFGGTAETHLDRVRGDVRYHPPRCQAPPHAARACPRVIVRVRYRPFGPGAQAERLPPEAVALMLVSLCFGGLERSPRTLDVVAAFSRIPCYSLEYDALEAARDAIRDLVGAAEEDA